MARVNWVITGLRNYPSVWCTDPAATGIQRQRASGLVDPLGEGTEDCRLICPPIHLVSFRLMTAVEAAREGHG